LKAAIVGSHGRLELADVQVPKIGRRETLVKMKMCGICGTDLEKLHGVRVTPPVLGKAARYCCSEYHLREVTPTWIQAASSYGISASSLATRLQRTKLRRLCR
jgi:hypothetical protein